MVMFLYRDEYYNKDTADKQLLECIITKHRNSGIGTMRLRWQPEYQKISQVDVSIVSLKSKDCK